ncbi:MAG: hypothetical protein MPK06_07845 [Alphaproteobacteria bacterium]|nr:hypothetical protein [Alphaproteobacteria bacterium]MDA8004574.1 hypothetical protein [Alphaproteobacteria bacterium]MDA8006424.1 hypothetical protein [Alphaproteobacteria bacterium]MDA8013830.1 hypothetical protein [Alphaproteobacteria bacterium]
MTYSPRVIIWIVATGVVGLPALFFIYLSERGGDVFLTAVRLIFSSSFAIVAVPFMPFWAGFADGRLNIFASAFAALFFCIAVLAAFRGLACVPRFPRKILYSAAVKNLFASLVLPAVYSFVSSIILISGILVFGNFDEAGSLVPDLDIIVPGSVLYAVSSYISFRVTFCLTRGAGTTLPFVLFMGMIVWSLAVNPVFISVTVPMAIGACAGKYKVDKQRRAAN